MITKFEHLNDRFGPSFQSILAMIQNDHQNNNYVIGHSARLAATIVLLNQIIDPSMKILELGWSNLLHHYITKSVKSWDFTTLPASGKGGGEVLDSTAQMRAANSIVPMRQISINFEEEYFPPDIDKYDLVVCCEVIEHMDVDPMHLMSEINRITIPGGKLFITTPNSVSSRIVFKVINGYHPSFFMKYSRDRSRYRHNFEYTPELLTRLIHSSGFTTQSLETIDTLENPFPQGYDLLNLVKANTNFRGDNIFLIATHTSPVLDRYPDGIY